MFGGASNSSATGSKSENDSKPDDKPPSPDTSPDPDSPPSTNNTAAQASVSGEKRSGNDSPPARHDSGDRKRRSSGVGSKLLASAKNSLSFSQITRSNSDLGGQTALQKLGKHDPALAVPQGQHNNSAGESVPGLASTFRVGVWEDRNKKCRRTMEDTHAFLYNFLNAPPPETDGSTINHKSESEEVQTAVQDLVESDNGYFAIFDGHAGTFAADWCGKKLHLILEDLIRKNPNVSIPELLDQTFTSVDAQLEKLPLKNSGCTAAIAVLRWEDRVPSDRSVTGSMVIAQAALQAAGNKNAKVQDAPLPEKEKEGSAEAATTPSLPSETMTAKLKETSTRHRILYTANVGDARIILCRSGRALRLSYDHKGSDENEGKRIASAGGLILNNRVNGVLAVTRALGDTYMKDLVTGHPYTTETVVQPEIDEFLIIACDGLWDVCSDQEAVDLVRDIQNPVVASKLLVDHALSRFSTDNLSCMIIRLDKEGHMQAQRGQSAAVGADNNASRVSEADKIVQETKQKITEGVTPALGVSASNNGLGYETAPAQDGEFIPTILNGTVEEEPALIGET